MPTLKLDESTQVYVESRQVNLEPGEYRDAASPADRAEDLIDDFPKYSQAIYAVVNQLALSAKALKDNASSLEIELGIALSAKGSLVLCSGEAEAGIKVKVVIDFSNQ